MITVKGFSQTQRNSFIQPEYTFGKIIPNYADTFPKTTVQQGLTINIGSVNADTSSWAKYFNQSPINRMFLNPSMQSFTRHGYKADRWIRYLWSPSFSINS